MKFFITPLCAVFFLFGSVVQAEEIIDFNSNLEVRADGTVIVTETERYKFFDAPDKNPEIFMEFLPYAIAFGVEKEWSKVFAGITIPTPNWYDGGAIQAFSVATLTTDIVAFSRALSASTTSKSSGTTVLQVEDFLAVSEVGGGGGSW